MANSHDPHRPFYGSLQERQVCERVWSKHGVHLEDIPAPSRIYDSHDVQVPGFLPDIPGVRKEVAQYYCSVRRCDDTVGRVLSALHESGQEENTVVMFLSDNGMSFPFAKTNCYLNSTHTPWIVRWPGRVKPGAVNTRDFIEGIDFMPTILDAAGLPTTPGMDGKSFLPLLDGQEQPGRDHVFTVFHKTAGRKSYPMRCLRERRLGYIYNAWADGKTVGSSLDHAMWFHRPFRADQWLLYAQESPVAAGGRGLARGELYTRSGELVVSVMQEGLVRTIS